MAWTPTGNIQGAKGDDGADSTVPGPKGDKGDTGDAGTTTWAGITDKPAVIGAGTSATAARAAISAGTSDLALGTTSTTALAGNTTAAGIGAAKAAAAVPTGGSSDQVLAKKSGSNYDTEWVDSPDFGAKVLVLGSSDPIPGGTPTGTVIFRTA